MDRARFPLRLSASLLAAATSILLLAIAGPLHAQRAGASQPKDARIDSLIQMLGQTKDPHEATISPDGKIVAWSVEASDGTQIHLSDVANPTSDTIIRTEAEATD